MAELNELLEQAVSEAEGLAQEAAHAQETVERLIQLAASMEAAARPAKTGFLFYVVKPGTCGEHNFAKTDAEFQGYVNEYNRARDDNGGKSPTTC